MAWRPQIHRPVGWQDKRERDREYAQYRNRTTVALMRSAEWRQARTTFLAVHAICALCGAPANVVDHVIPHRGNVAAFWDQSNWQPLCSLCHNRKTAARDGGFGNARK